MTIRRATDADVPRLARTITLAFADDPVMRWMMPDDEDYFSLNPELTAWMCRRWQATDSHWCTDDGVAMAGWVPPGRPSVELDPPAIEHPPWRLARFAAIRSALDAHTPWEPHWYLNVLATHPDWQRQGLGSALLAVVFEIASEFGVPCYLETETTDLVAFYRRHGFVVRSEWDLEADGERGPHMWGMWRPAP